VLPFWLAFVAPADLRVILIFRIVRFLKLVRYSPGMRSLLSALYTEPRALLGCPACPTNVARPGAWPPWLPHGMVVLPSSPIMPRVPEWIDPESIGEAR